MLVLDFDSSSIAERNLFFCYCEVGVVMDCVLIDRVKNPSKTRQKRDSYIHILLHTEFRNV